jgi:hypothetical protein
LAPVGERRRPRHRIELRFDDRRQSVFDPRNVGDEKDLAKVAMEGGDGWEIRVGGDGDLPPTVVARDQRASADPSGPLAAARREAEAARPPHDGESRAVLGLAWIGEEQRPHARRTDDPHVATCETGSARIKWSSGERSVSEAKIAFEARRGKIDVRRFDVDPDTVATPTRSRDVRRTTPHERIEDGIADKTEHTDETLGKGDGIRRWMVAR